MLRLRFKVQLHVILLAVLTGGIISSCSRTDKAYMYDEIQIGTTSVGTKALVTNKASLISLSITNSTGFGVYGYKTIPNKTPYRQFNNIPVYPDQNTESTTWSYTPRRYWDSNPNATYQFAAYWPYLPNEDPNNGTPFVSETGKVLTINNIPYWQPTSTGTDLLVAARSGKYKSTEDDATLVFAGGTVNFQFEHILSRVQVRAYYVGAKAKVTVNQLTFKSPDEDNPIVLKADGKSVVTRNFSENNTTNQYSSPVQKGLSKELMEDPVILPEETWFDEDPDSEPENFQTLCSWFTVPCNLWNGLDLQADYSIENSPLQGTAHGVTLTTQVKNNQNEVTATYPGQTLPGYSYLITLKFTASSGIELESVQVKNWADGGEIPTNVHNW